MLILKLLILEMSDIKNSQFQKVIGRQKCIFNSSFAVQYCIKQTI